MVKIKDNEIKKSIAMLYDMMFIKYDIVIVLSLVVLFIVVDIITYVLTDTYEEYYTEVKYEYVEPEPVVEDKDIPALVIHKEKEIVNPLDLYSFDLTGFINVNTELNIRQEPNTDSEILGKLTWMDKVSYSVINDDWAIIKYSDTVGYIANKYITDTEETYVESYSVSGDKSKTYMDYRKITDRTSKQYALQLRASTDQDNGLRILRNRYMVAIGSYFGCKVGQFIDVELSDGEVLKCIVGDAKQDIHTDDQNLHGLNGDTVEFIVNENVLKDKTTVKGNISDVSDVFDGKVVEIRKYDHVER